MRGKATETKKKEKKRKEWKNEKKNRLLHIPKLLSTRKRTNNVIMRNM